MNSSSFLRSPATQCKRPLKLSAPLIHTLRLVPGGEGASAFLRASSRSPLWGWSRVWSRLGRRSRPSPPSKARLRVSLVLLDLLFGVPLGRDRTRPPPAEAEAMERASECLPARRGGPLSEQLQGEQAAQRERSHPWEVGESSSSKRSRRSFASSPAAVPGLFSSGRRRRLRPPGGSGRRRRRRWCASRKRSGDLGGRATIRGEQRDVHPEPSTGFRLALHPKDEVLAFFGGDDDTLHGRPSLWWLDGFGVFTMPQRTAACSIILCIYLVACVTSSDALLYTHGSAGTGEGRAHSATGGAQEGVQRPWWRKLIGRGR